MASTESRLRELELFRQQVQRQTVRFPKIITFTGLINGSNCDYLLADFFIIDSLMVFKTGSKVLASGYSVNERTVTFTVAPVEGSTLEFLAISK